MHGPATPSLVRALPLLPILPLLLAPAVARADGLDAPPVGLRPSPACAQPGACGSSLARSVRREKLPNGLRVVLAPDHTSPTVAVCVAYDVGGRDEDRAHAGYAHLLEHLMFQGSKNVAAGAHFALAAARGAKVDAATTPDHSSYAELLPSSELALGLWLEADRMKSLSISATALEAQRDVVRDEYRLRTVVAPYGLSTQKLRELVYDGYFPYAHETLAAAAAMEDVDAAQLRAFHDAYYTPGNAVLAVVGDVEPEEALRLAARFFEGARGEDAPKRSAAALPEQTAPRQAVVEDARAPLPALLYGWSLPPARDKEHAALELAAIVLGDGESSRLYRALVHEQSLAADVRAETAGLRGPDLFTVTIKLTEGSASTVEARLSRAERFLVGELRNLARVGPSDAELLRAKSRKKTRALVGLESNLSRARALAELELDAGDARLLAQDADRYDAVTREDVKRAALAYLGETRWSRVEVKAARDATSPPVSGEP